MKTWLEWQDFVKLLFETAGIPAYVLYALEGPPYDGRKELGIFSSWQGPLDTKPAIAYNAPVDAFGVLGDLLMESNVENLAMTLAANNKGGVSLSHWFVVVRSGGSNMRDMLLALLILYNGMYHSLLPYDSCEKEKEKEFTLTIVCSPVKPLVVFLASALHAQFVLSEDSTEGTVTLSDGMGGKIVLKVYALEPEKV